MDRLFVTLQYLLPHHLLCRIVYALTRAQRPWLRGMLIRAFVRHYHPRMDEAAEPEPLRYPSFNAFFTRALRPGARPLAPDSRQLLSPCDARISMAGTLADGELLQAKGQRYSLAALLAHGDGSAGAWTERFRNGRYATLYLAPYDYHRIHMPMDGRLVAAWHVAGRLFSVNAATTARVPGLFARNERVVCVFEGERGPFAVILVGALFVGSMATVWHGEVTPRRGAAGKPLTPRTDASLWQPRGAELGRFNMGSTVLLLLPPGAAEWGPECQPGVTVRMGQSLGTLAAGVA